MAGMMVKRGISTSAARMSEAGGHGAGAMKLWKNFSLFGALPVVGIMTANFLLHMQKEAACPPARAEFVPYEHLRIRTKRFPWGDGQKSLFHNPHVNPLPTGYEHDEH